jgi:hypothetical protein
MPIRINLLAEAQAAEEERRKDPVKRGTYVAGFLVCLVILWAAWLQVKVMGARGEMNQLEAKWKSIENNFQETVESQRRNMDAEAKLTSLQQMTTNRFLWGNVLNAFQQTMGGLDDVQVVRLKGEQAYILAEGTPSRTNGTTVIPGKPGTATERISMNVEAMDVSPQPGKRVNEFKESIANVSFFKESLTKTNGVLLTSRSAPQGSPNAPDGKQTFVMFSLKCAFPEKTR